MTRNIITLIGLALLVGCSGGGGDEAPSSSPSANNPTPSSPTEFLVATPTGLWRGQANGQGGIIFARANFQQATVLESEGNVVYSRDADIWTVRTDGTGDRALLQDGGGPEAFVGPWVVFQQGFEKRSIRLDTQAQFLLHTGPFHQFAPLDADRLLLNTEQEIFSLTFTGTNPVTHARLSDADFNQDIVLLSPLIVGNALTYLSFRMKPGFDVLASSHTVPLAGGTPVPFESQQEYTHVANFIGTRVVYKRCAFDTTDPNDPTIGPCDVVSAQNNGAGKVVLASHPANEAVQGVTTNQVIIRRNLSGKDQLVAVPVAGGPEKPLMTMRDNEFVDTISGDTIIVRRPTGTWTLDLNGNLKQIGTKPGLDFFRVIGDSICSDFGEIWCLPIDGSRAEVRIDRNGKFVGVL